MVLFFSFFCRSSVLFEVLSRIDSSSESLAMAVYWVQNMQFLSRSGQKCCEYSGVWTEEIEVLWIFSSTKDKIIVESNIWSFCLSLMVFLRPVKYHNMSMCTFSEMVRNYWRAWWCTSEERLTLSVFNRITCYFVTHVTVAFTWSAVTPLLQECQKVRTLWSKGSFELMLEEISA